MGIEFAAVAAPEVREAVVSFFWQQQHWPGKSIDDYYEMWDWRYTSLSDGAPYVYVARDTRTRAVVGHVAVYSRRFQIEGSAVTVGVPGNLVVHPDYRERVVGPRLVCYPRALVREGVLDMAIAFANAPAHALFSRLGFQDLGFMHSYVDIHRSASYLRRRMPVATPGGMLFDLAFDARRRMKQRAMPGGNGRFTVRGLSAGEFAAHSRAHWQVARDRFVTDGTPEFVAKRFLACPFAPRRMYGLFDRATARLQGFVILQGEPRAKVWDCQVNHAVLSEPVAISTVARALQLETVAVPTMPQTQLAHELRRAGFLHREPIDHIEQVTRLSAFWLPTHSLANQLGNIRRWNLWFGSNHY